MRTKQENGGDRWHWHGEFRRLKWRLEVFRHVYYQSSDRWVAQPSVIFDRKRK